MRHRTLTRLTLGFVATSLVLTTAAYGQAGEAREPTPLAREFDELNATLVRIESLLERMADTQGLDLMIKRMELTSRQAEDLEKRLAGLESERASIEDTIRRIEANREAYLADVKTRGDADSLLEAETMNAQAERELAFRAERRRALDDEIAVVRNRLESKRREFEDWQDYVDRRLGGV